MLNQTAAKKLLTVGRRVFSEAEKDAALAYCVEHECTLQEAAAQHGMSTQTLAIHRQKTLESHGLVPAKAKKTGGKKSKKSN